MKECLLDTDTLSYYLKGNEDVTKKTVEYLLIHPTLNISSITYYEILQGLEYKQASRQLENFEIFTANLNIINIDVESLKVSAKIAGYLKRKGITIGIADTLIAGVAIKNELCLITNNIRHYSDIENLLLDNWKS